MQLAEMFFPETHQPKSEQIDRVVSDVYNRILLKVWVWDINKLMKMKETV